MCRILALAGLLLAGTAVAAEKGPGVTIIKEWSGAYSAQEKPKHMVAKDQKAWEEIWSGMNGNISPKPETPKIDFDRQMVIAVFMGTRNTGGYSVKITRIESNGTLMVWVKQSSPPPGMMVTEALTAPYHAVVVPKSDKAIDWGKQQ
jgi:hypothetical protein